TDEQTILQHHVRRCKTNAVGYVERFGPDLEYLTFCNPEVLVNGFIPRPDFRAPDRAECHIPVRTGSRSREGGSVQPGNTRCDRTRLTFVGRIDIGKDLIGPLDVIVASAGSKKAVQCHIGTQVWGERNAGAYREYRPEMPAAQGCVLPGTRKCRRARRECNV